MIHGERNAYATRSSRRSMRLRPPGRRRRRIGEDFRPEAIKRVKRGLILEAIAKKEGVTVSDVEVDAEIRRAANEQVELHERAMDAREHPGALEPLRNAEGFSKLSERVARATELLKRCRLRNANPRRQPLVAGQARGLEARRVMIERLVVVTGPEADETEPPLDERYARGIAALPDVPESAFP